MLQVHIPALPVSGQLNVALSGEVTIPVSGGIITIPVSHLPPHLQVRHVSSLTSCYLACVYKCTLYYARVNVYADLFHKTTTYIKH